jgi:uncharacterized protein with von Willebrand factor type A (vWA) domain
MSTLCKDDGLSQDAAQLMTQVVHFSRFLRSAGVPASPPQVLDFVHCLPLIDFTDRASVRDAGRAIFVRDHAQIALYERAFDRFWSPALLDPQAQRSLLEDRRSEGVWAVEGVQAADLLGDLDTHPDRTLAWSAAERLRRRDFGELSAAETAAIHEAMHSLARRLPARRSRRLVPSVQGRRIDLRGTLRRSLRTAGDPLRLARRGRRVKPRPILLLCDVSASMERYARILLQFACALAGAQGRRQGQIEAFAFATRLTRVTGALPVGAGPAQAQAALDAAVAATTDWGGGTRIGACLRSLRTRWPQTVRRGAIVLLISDGCDRGEVALLGRELAGLQRRCHRLIWLNPWLGQEGYQPATRGMQAALPHIDRLLPIHNLQSLEELVAALGRMA